MFLSPDWGKLDNLELCPDLGDRIDPNLSTPGVWGSGSGYDAYVSLWFGHPFVAIDA